MSMLAHRWLRIRKDLKRYVAKDLRPDFVEHWFKEDTTTLEGMLTYYYCKDMDAYERYNLQTYIRLGLDEWIPIIDKYFVEEIVGDN